MRRTINRHLLFGGTLLGTLILLMLIACLATAITTRMDMNSRLCPACEDHWLGTDHMGRDLLSVVVLATALSVTVALTVVILSTLLGCVLGAIAGFSGGVLDSLVMRCADVIFAFPGILLAIGLSSLFDSGLSSLIVILTFTTWPGCARLVRAEMMKFKHNPFIMAARSYGAGPVRLVLIYLFPLVRPMVLVQASLAIGGIILAESSLNFLGCGFDPLTPSLGQLVSDGRMYMFEHPVLVFIPGLVLLFLVLGFNLVAEGIRQRMIP